MQDRGFGFVTDAQGEDVFVHANQLPEDIRQGKPPLLESGQRVMFERREDARGPQAQNVRVCADPDVITEAEFRTEIATLGPGPAVGMVLQVARSHGWVV